jgi:hypothetical protein
MGTHHQTRWREMGGSQIIEKTMRRRVETQCHHQRRHAV